MRKKHEASRHPGKFSETDFNSEVSESIRYFRQRSGFKQREVAEHLSLSLRNYQKIEAGDIEVRNSHVHGLADFFKVPSCYMFRPPEAKVLEKFKVPCRTEVLDVLPVGVRFIDLSGKIHYTNRAHDLLLGPHPDFHDHKQGLTVFDFAADRDEFERMQKVHHEVVNSRPVPTPFSFRHLSKSGQEIHIRLDWSYQYASDGALHGFIAVLVPLLDL